MSSPFHSPHVSKVVKLVSFRIRRRYFTQIVAGTKKEEIRTDKPYWRKILLGSNPPEIAVFVCGKDVHYRWIKGKPYLDDPEQVLGRPLSEQGIQDVLTNPAIIVPLGERAIKWCDVAGNVLHWLTESEVDQHNRLVREIKESTGEARIGRAFGYLRSEQYRSDVEKESPDG